jgi:ribosomal protein S18 acetylase RimI-like enzyme
LTGAVPLTIRPARAEDLPALGRITAARQGGSAEEHAASLRRFLDSARGADCRALLLTAEWDGEVAGFGKCHRYARPPDPPPNAGPEGWYLAGVIVDERHRRRGIGRALTEARLRWIAQRSDRAYYFANARNAASIALHRAFGFRELARDFSLPGAQFEGGVGILFEAEVRRD